MKKSYTVLYVDDDIDDLDLIVEAFQTHSSHFFVVYACNGIEGLKVLEEMYEHNSLPCLIIIDINMPVMDGKEMLENLRQQSKFAKLPVVMFSTSGAEIDRTFALKYHAEFISKPSRYHELKNFVEQFVRKCNLETKADA